MSSNEHGRLYSSKFYDLKFNLVFFFDFIIFEILDGTAYHSGARKKPKDEQYPSKKLKEQKGKQ
jgi:hypothetical protein